MSEETVPVVSQCLCKAHTFTTSVKKSALPLKLSACHCDSCRHMTGGLYLPEIAWPNHAEDFSSLQPYYFSETLIAYSCKTCGTHMFSKRTTPGAIPDVMSGTLNNPPDLLEYDRHIFVEETLDGGATPWLSKSHRDGRTLKCWKKWNPAEGRPGEELDASWLRTRNLPAPLERVAPGTTPFHCHCGGVNLLLRSAADLTTPDEELPFYIDPETRKYLVTSCSCEYCRRPFGVDVVSWTYAQLDHIEFPTASDAPSKSGAFPSTISALRNAVSAPSETRDPRLGTLELHKSSAEVDRYHCSRCSASVFYAVCDRPETIEIAVGLLSHPSGARAEGLLRWDYAQGVCQDSDKGGWREGFTRQVKKERDEWRVQRGYPEVWERLRQERRKIRVLVIGDKET